MAELAKQMFVVTEEDMKTVRAHYDITQEDIDKDCEIIKTWMAQQSHFPEDYDKDRIERFHLRNKFRVERTKEKLENYYTVRGDKSEDFKGLDPEKEMIQTALITVMWLPLPKMHLSMERLYLLRFIGNDHLYSIVNARMISFALTELEMVHDYSVGVRLLIDLKNMSMTHYTNMDINVIAKTLFLLKECLSGRILGLDYLNAPSFMSMVLGLFKLVFPPRLYNKIRIHNDLESLKDAFDEECLPSDYGGSLKSSEELHEDVKNMLMKNRDFLLNRVDMVSDESKRVGEVKKNYQFGADGTFKNIHLD